MLSTLMVIGGVLVGLLVLLALIVALSSRPKTRGTTTAGRTGAEPAARTPGWVVDAGQKHPDAWSPLSNTSTEIRAIRP